MVEIIVGFVAVLLFVAILCMLCYMDGYKKGVEETVEFHNRIWKEAERRIKEALKDGNSTD